MVWRHRQSEGGTNSFRAVLLLLALSNVKPARKDRGAEKPIIHRVSLRCYSVQITGGRSVLTYLDYRHNT